MMIALRKKRTSIHIPFYHYPNRKVSKLISMNNISMREYIYLCCSKIKDDS